MMASSAPSRPSTRGLEAATRGICDGQKDAETKMGLGSQETVTAASA